MKVTEFDFLSLSGQIAGLRDFTEQLQNNILAAITTPVVEQTSANEDVISQRMERIFAKLDQVIGVVDGLDSKIITAVNIVDRENQLIAENIANGIRADIERFNQNNANTGAAVAARIERELQGKIAGGFNDVLNIISPIENKIGEAVGEVANVATTIEDTVSTRITEELGSVNETIEPIVLRTQELVRSLRETLPDTLDALPGNLASGLLSGVGSLFPGLQAFLKLFDIGHWREALDQIDSVYSIIEDAPFIGPLIKVFTPQGSPLVGVIGVAVLTAVVVGLVNAGVSSTFAGELEESTQWSMQRTRPSLLVSSEIRDLLNRAMIADDVAIHELAQAGFSDEKIEQLLELRYQLFNLGEIVTLWRRNKFDDTEFQKRLDAVGFRREDVQHIETLAFAIPGIQDIILFAVREVFDFDTANRFGAFEGLSPESLSHVQETFGQFGAGIEGGIKAFEEFARQAGLAPEWAAAYWASHWRLPSPTALYEMVHRLAPDIVESKRDDFIKLGLDPDGLPFTIDDLQIMLRAQDYTPFFRERLTALSYKPMTRVDVRRMHSLGIINEREVTLRYRELGYSPDDAELMTQFTLAYNATPDVVEERETKELTRTQILLFYNKGFFTEEQAITALVSIDYPLEVSEVFVSIETMRILDKQQDQQIAIITERFKAGLIGFDDAMIALDALELPALQKERIAADFEADIASDIRMPTQAQIDDAVDAKMVDQNEYRKLMGDLGYDTLWQDRLTSIRFELWRTESEGDV